jgi:hypothetical protein
VTVVKQRSRKRGTPTNARIFLGVKLDEPALPDLERTFSMGNGLIVSSPDPIQET